jgi:group I intron endonuclease
MRETCGIYKITNIKNDKVYIGSSKNILNRWGNHIFELVSCKHYNTELQKDFDKYGIENFIFQVIEILDNKNKILEREQYYIEKYNSLNPEKGYNIMSSYGNYKNDFINKNIKKSFANMNIYDFEYNFNKKYFNQDKYFMSYSWFKKSSNKRLKEVSNSLYNISRNKFNYFNRDEICWTTFFQYKNEIQADGIIKQYNYLFKPNIDKSNKVLLIYANIFPNKFEIDLEEDFYTKIILKNFIYNNINLNNEYIVYTPINRIKRLLEEIKNEQH